MANAGTQVHFACSDWGQDVRLYILYYIFKFIYIIIYINYIKRYYATLASLDFTKCTCVPAFALPYKMGAFERYGRIWWIVNEIFVKSAELSLRW